MQEKAPERRGTHLPYLFIALCHALGGGCPSQALTIAHELVDGCPDQAPLGYVCSHMITRHIHRTVGRDQKLIASFDEEIVGLVSRWVNEATISTSAATLETLAMNPPDLNREPRACSSAVSSRRRSSSKGKSCRTTRRTTSGGWSYNSRRARRLDLNDPTDQLLARLGVDGCYERPPSRTAESEARSRAMRAIGYRGWIDQDGYPADGPGADPSGFAVGPGHAQRDGYRSLTMIAQAAARFDGGWDGDDDGQGPLIEWLDHHQHRYGGDI